LLKRNLIITFGTSPIWNFNSWYFFFFFFLNIFFKNFFFLYFFFYIFFFYFFFFFFFKYFFSNIFMVEIWCVYFYLEVLSLNLVILFTNKILSLKFFLHLEWVNFFISALVHECILRIKINLVLLIDVS